MVLRTSLSIERERSFGPPITPSIAGGGRKRRKGRETAQEPRQELDSRVAALSAEYRRCHDRESPVGPKVRQAPPSCKAPVGGSRSPKISLCSPTPRNSNRPSNSRRPSQRPAASANRDENRICRLSRSQSFSIRTTSLTAGPITVKSSRSAAPTLPYSTSPTCRAISTSANGKPAASRSKLRSTYVPCERPQLVASNCHAARRPHETP